MVGFVILRSKRIHKQIVNMFTPILKELSHLLVT